MSDNANDDSPADFLSNDSIDLQSTPVTSTYKVLGHLDADNGVGVLGQNDANSGTPIGVQGAVPNSSDGYGLATPDDARISGGLELDGTLDTTTAFQLNIDGSNNIYHGSDDGTGEAGRVVLGHSSNKARAALGVFPAGATISGGGFDDGTDVEPNVVLDNYGTVSGGQNNQAGVDNEDPTIAPHATVGGGNNNTASGEESTVSGGSNNTATRISSTIGGGNNNTANNGEATVGGGTENTASGVNSTVAGGSNNTATRLNSTVGGGKNNTASGIDSTVCGGDENTASGVGSTVPGGENGAAKSDNSFVWNDDTQYHNIPNTDTNGLSSDTAVNGEPVSGANTFSVSAQGGVRFITGSSEVTFIDAGTTGWSSFSSRAAKTNIDPVDPAEVLAGVEELDVATWEYEGDDGEGAGTTHIGPMAEEFHEIVDVGSSDEHINTLNADGVLFAAVQGLSAKVDEQEAEFEEKNKRIEQLEAENEQLRERLAAIEDHLDLDSTTEPTPADD